MSGLKPLAHSLNMLARTYLCSLEIHTGTEVPPALISPIDHLVTALRLGIADIEHAIGRLVPSGHDRKHLPGNIR